jgi:hypothetical protein
VRRTLLLAVLALLGLTFLGPPAEQARVPRTAPYHAYDFHWRDRSITVVDEVVRHLRPGRAHLPRKWREARNKVLAEFNATGVVTLQLVVEPAPGTCHPLERSYEDADAATAGTIRFCRTFDRSSAYGGWAYWRRDPDGHIAAAVVVVNGRTGGRLILCHELGHALGLDHRSQSTSCMSGGPGSGLDQHDRDELAALYGHTD